MWPGDAIAPWVAQVLGALVFGIHSVTFLVPARARAQLPYARALSDATLRFIGVVEVAGAIGLILPGLTGIAAWLTPAAGVGLAVVMVLGIVFHIARREWPNVVLNFALGLIAAFVAYGRFALDPFAGR